MIYSMTGYAALTRDLPLGTTRKRTKRSVVDTAPLLPSGQTRLSHVNARRQLLGECDELPVCELWPSTIAPSR